ncbi:MAG: hypothetical protein RL518_84 [Pseudomonadota bacterium]
MAACHPEALEPSCDQLVISFLVLSGATLSWSDEPFIVPRRGREGDNPRVPLRNQPRLARERALAWKGVMDTSSLRLDTGASPIWVSTRCRR